MKTTRFILAVISLSMMGVVDAAVDCNSFLGNTIIGNINDDVMAVGYTCTVSRSAVINGNLIQTGPGGLLIRGSIGGSVSESGNGSVVIERGKINGEVSEADDGDLTVRLGGSANGGLEESGNGSAVVNVDIPGVVNSDVLESGPGNVVIRALSGSYEGSVIENDDGSVAGTVKAGVSFKGGIEEYGKGSVSVAVEGLYEGNITERGAGNVSTSGIGTFKGNSEHELPGNCDNSIFDFQGVFCNIL